MKTLSAVSVRKRLHTPDGTTNILAQSFQRLIPGGLIGIVELPVRLGVFMCHKLDLVGSAYVDKLVLNMSGPDFNAFITEVTYLGWHDSLGIGHCFVRHKFSVPKLAIGGLSSDQWMGNWSAK